MNRLKLLTGSFFLAQTLMAQSVQVDSVTAPSSFRGMAVVSDAEIWISGSKGYIGHSIDSGKTYTFHQIPKYENAEIRDIEFLNDGALIAMSSTQPAAILRSTDKGATWKEVFRRDSSAYFLDAIDFSEKQGTCLGDPINGHFLILRTNDFGKTWKESYTNIVTDSLAAFAASGSTLQYLSTNEIVFGTGGKEALLFYSKDAGKTWETTEMLMNSGKESAGIFSVAVIDSKNIVCAGGDYLDPTNTDYNYLVVTNIDGAWDYPIPVSEINNESSGYYSCVDVITNNNITTFFACGTGGVDVWRSTNFNIKVLSMSGFNVLQISPSGKYVFLAGNKIVGKMDI